MAWPTVNTGVGASSNPAPGSGTLSWSHTVAAGQTLLQVVIGAGASTGSNPVNVITGVTWNGGTALTRKGVADDGNYCYGMVYELANPAAATSTVIVSYNNTTGNSAEIAGNSISFDGASTTTGTFTSNTTNNTTNPTLTVADSANGDVVVSLWMTDDSIPATAPNGTSLQDAEDINTDTDVCSQYQSATGANTVCSWTHTSGGGGAGVMVGVAVRRAGGLALEESYWLDLEPQTNPAFVEVY
jgi:hypothetical protein